MAQDNFKMNPNRLVQFLQKPMKEFTKDDMMRVIEEFEIEMINFRYMGNEAAKYMMDNSLCLEEFLALYGVE